MIIGKWNKSVLLTYFGLIISVLGMLLALEGNINYAFICMIIAGICDLFDGFVARRCKRTKEEKQFGIELDSLVDVVDFGVFPIVLFIGLGLTNWYNVIIFFIYIVCQIARLAYFNITLEEENKEKPVKYYSGLPTTFSALILPLVYLLSYVLDKGIFDVLFAVVMLIIAVLNILNVKIPKPKGVAYIVFSLMAIAVIVLYVVL